MLVLQKYSFKYIDSSAITLNKLNIKYFWSFVFNPFIKVQINVIKDNTSIIILQILLGIILIVFKINNIIKYFYSIFKGKIIITLRPIFYSLLGIVFYQNILLGILCGTCIYELIDVIINLFINFMKKFQK